MTMLRSGPIAISEDILARSPDHPSCISERVFVDLQHRDFRSTELGRLGVRDDLSQPKRITRPALGDSSTAVTS